MSRRAIVSVLGATTLLAASIAGASSASAVSSGATAPASQSFGTDVPVFTAVEKVISITASGEAVTFGDTSTIAPVGGADDQADDYQVVDDGCAGASLDAGASCDVTVEFRPFNAGTRQAALEVDTTSPAGTVSVDLTGEAVGDATGTYYGITPKRFIDTRKDGSRKPLAKSSTTKLQIGGLNGVPASGVSAVVINLTAVTTTSQGYFTAYPSGQSRPTASSINFPKGWTGANMVTVPLGADGKIAIYNYGGASHAIVDVLGWYAKDDSVQAAKGMGNQFFPTETGDPVRIYDSRKDATTDYVPFLGGDYLNVADTWATQAGAQAVKSYVVNVTAVDATKDGVLTLWNGVGGKPTVSTVNYVPGTIAPNMAVVPAQYYTTDEDEDGILEQNSGFRLQNTGSGSVHVVVDLVGYYLADQPAGFRFVPRSTPKRLVDTREKVGAKTVLSGAFGTTARTVNATSVATPDSYFVVANATGITPTKRTYLTVWSGEGARPSASNINVNPGLVRSASMYAPLREAAGSKLTFNVYNNSGSMHLAIDVAGTLNYYPGAALVPTATAAKNKATADSRTADRTLGGRTIPGAASIAADSQGITHRRG